MIWIRFQIIVFYLYMKSSLCLALNYGHRMILIRTCSFIQSSHFWRTGYTETCPKTFSDHGAMLFYIYHANSLLVREKTRLLITSGLLNASIERIRSFLNWKKILITFIDSKVYWTMKFETVRTRTKKILLVLVPLYNDAFRETIERRDLEDNRTGWY